MTLWGDWLKCFDSSTVLSLVPPPPLSLSTLPARFLLEKWPLLRILLVFASYVLTFFIVNNQLQNKILYGSLAETDPEVQNIIDKETWRQLNGLELIASEVLVYGVRFVYQRLMSECTELD